MRSRMSLFFAGVVACAGEVPVKDGAVAGDDKPAQVEQDMDGDAVPAIYTDDGAQYAPPESGYDCEDGNPAVFPGAVEVPNDGFDNDCDGVYE